MKTTFHLALDDNERSIIIRYLNSLRNRLITQGVGRCDQPLLGAIRTR